MVVVVGIGVDRSVAQGGMHWVASLILTRTGMVEGYTTSLDPPGTCLESDDPKQVPDGFTDGRSATPATALSVHQTVLWLRSCIAWLPDC